MFDDAQQRTIPCDTVLLAVGQATDLGFLKDGETGDEDAPEHDANDPPVWVHEPESVEDITLAVAGKLAAALRDRGVRVVMTRSTDTLIALSDRGRIANEAGGAVFLSIHVNAHRNPDVRGVEVASRSQVTSPGSILEKRTRGMPVAATRSSRMTAQLVDPSAHTTSSLPRRAATRST